MRKERLLKLSVLLRESGSNDLYSDSIRLYKKSEYNFGKDNNSSSWWDSITSGVRSLMGTPASPARTTKEDVERERAKMPKESIPVSKRDVEDARKALRSGQTPNVPQNLDDSQAQRFLEEVTGKDPTSEEAHKTVSPGVSRATSVNMDTAGNRRLVEETWLTAEELRKRHYQSNYKQIMDKIYQLESQVEVLEDDKVDKDLNDTFNYFKDTIFQIPTRYGIVKSTPAWKSMIESYEKEIDKDLLNAKNLLNQLLFQKTLNVTNSLSKLKKDFTPELRQKAAAALQQEKEFLKQRLREFAGKLSYLDTPEHTDKMKNLIIQMNNRINEINREIQAINDWNRRSLRTAARLRRLNMLTKLAGITK